jgi:N-acetylglucosamine malate deacetylase 1
MAKPLRILCFGAHPDDCEIFAGGTLLALRAIGAEVTFVVATDGSLSLGPPPNEELAAARRTEAEQAARILGAELEMLGFRDGALALASEAMAAIEAVLERRRPDLVLTHHPRDVHRDHREVSRLVTARVRETQRYLYMEPLYGVVESPNLLVDTTAHWETKALAVRQHATQNAEREILPGIETWNRFRALQLGGRGVTHAEGFVVPPCPSWMDPSRILAKAARTRAV